MPTKQKKKNRRIDVQIDSVVPFSDAQQNALHQKLKAVLGSDRVQVQFALNPDLLGGMTIRMGAQLLNLSFPLLNKSFK